MGLELEGAYTVLQIIVFRTDSPSDTQWNTLLGFIKVDFEIVIISMLAYA